VAPDFNSWANSEKNQLFYPFLLSPPLFASIHPIQTVKSISSHFFHLSLPHGDLKFQPRERLKIGSKRIL
jgi:hypothetical protein